MLPQLIPRFEVDDAALSALYARAFDGPAEVRPWAACLDRYALTWIGAFADGDLVGFLQVCTDGGEHAFLLDTAVDPAWQHQGLGARLVRAAADESRAAGCTWLHVDYEPHLDAFYRDRCGFTATPAALLRLTP